LIGPIDLVKIEVVRFAPGALAYEASGPLAQQLEGLNIDVNVDHNDPATVAAQWLKSEGLT